MYDNLLPVLQNTNAATIQKKISFVPVKGKQYVPQLHGFVQPELLSEQQRQPTETVVLWYDLLFVQTVPQFVVHHLQILVQHTHPPHYPLLRLVHIFDMHVNQESHQRRKHEKHLALRIHTKLLEL